MSDPEIPVEKGFIWFRVLGAVVIFGKCLGKVDPDGGCPGMGL